MTERITEAELRRLDVPILYGTISSANVGNNGAVACPYVDQSGCLDATIRRLVAEVRRLRGLKVTRVWVNGRPFVPDTVIEDQRDGTD